MGGAVTSYAVSSDCSVFSQGFEMSETWQVVFGVVGVLVGILFLIGCIIFVVKPWPSQKPLGESVVWHQLPAMRGDGSMPCCGQHPNQIPGYDRLTPNPYQVTCGRLAGQPRRAAV